MKITKKEWKAITKAAGASDPAAILFIVNDWNRTAKMLQSWCQRNLDVGLVAGFHVADVVVAELDRTRAKKRKGGGR